MSVQECFEIILNMSERSFVILLQLVANDALLPEINENTLIALSAVMKLSED